MDILARVSADLVASAASPPPTGAALLTPASSPLSNPSKVFSLRAATNQSMGKKSRRVRPAKDALKDAAKPPSPPDDDVGACERAMDGVTLADAADTAAASGVSKLCAVCGKPGVLSCSACRHEFYCGPTCQRSHWPLHKGECTARYMLHYTGQINDGADVDKRETQYEFKETIESKKLVRDWSDTTKGSRLLDGLRLKYAGKKLALRDDWSCVSCGGPAARIVSRTDLHLVSQRYPGADGRIYGGITVMGTLDYAACNHQRCSEYVNMMTNVMAEVVAKNVTDGTGFCDDGVIRRGA